MLKKGILTKWNDDKGFGFITPEGEKKGVFVHIKDFKNRQKRPTLNQNVTFTLSRVKDKINAINVEIDNNSPILRKKGILTKWDDDKGYGFITPVGEKQEVFVHISEFQRRPVLYDRVSFTLSKDKSDRDCAINIIMFEKAKLNDEVKKTNTISLLSIFTITIFFLILFYFTQNKTIEPYTIPYYVLISILTFYIYSNDKNSAQDGGWRTSEDTLHILSIIGGWVGALIAQDKLQHKSRKKSFKTVFFITILLNLVLLFSLNFFKYI